MDEITKRVMDGLAASNHGTPLERALAATELYMWGREQFLPHVAALRRAAVRSLRAEGHSLQEVADMLGVTDARVSQILGS